MKSISYMKKTDYKMFTTIKKKKQLIPIHRKETTKKHTRIFTWLYLLSGNVCGFPFVSFKH